MRNKKRTLKYFGIFVFLLAISLIGTTIYRPYIYSHGIYDYHLADTLPSIFCVPVAFSCGLFIYSFFGKELTNGYNEIFACAIGFYLYEFLELLTGGFDWFDCLAIAAGTLITLFVYYCSKK